MSYGTPLINLSRMRGSQTICVQVLRSYFKRYTHCPPERRLILADEQGERIPATIRHEELSVFNLNLLEGKWYFANDFEVEIKGDDVMFSTHPYHIFFNANTRVQPAPDIKLSNMFPSYCHFYDYLHRTDWSRVNNADLLGVIVHVKRMKEYPEIDTPCGPIPAQKSITFQLQDFQTDLFNCVAQGGHADKFLELWLQRPAYSPVVCVLRFWDVEKDGGDLLFRASKNYSQILFEPRCREVKKAKAMLHGSGDFNDKIDEYEDYPDRPQLPF